MSYLLLWVGEEGRQIYKSWTGISEADAKKLKTYCDRFNSHVQPKLNPIFARYRFYNETQEHDSIDVFVTRLRIRARDCNFRVNEHTDITADMIRDRIVFGCDQKVREKLINEGDKLTMDRAIQIVQNHEYCQKQLNSMAMNIPTNIDAIGRRQQSGANSRRQTKPGPRSKPCDRCGNYHNNDSVCPAKGKRCRKCKKMNHFQKVCRSKKFVNNVNENVSQSESCEDTEYSVNMVSASSSSTIPPDRDRDSLSVTLKIGPNSSNIKFKIDTGSSSNIIPFTMFKTLGIKSALEKPDCKLIAYSGDMLKTHGMLNLDCSYRKRNVETRFYIVHTNAPPLISTQTSIDLVLIKLTFAIDNQTMTKEYVMEEYNDLFHGIGLLPGKCHLHLRDNVTPTINAPRRIPEALEKRLFRKFLCYYKEKSSLHSAFTS